MNKPINWNQVTVGETEIDQPGCIKKLIVGVFGDYIWVYDFGGNYDTYHKDALKDWTIYDPWEEITSQCKFTPTDDGLAWHISFLGRYIRRSDNDFKVDDDGCRVWKRKEQS